MQRLSGNQGPDLLTALMNMSLVLREPRKMHLCRSLNAPRLPWLLEMLQTITFCRFLARCRIPCACHTKRHLNAQKCSERVSFWLRNVLRATTCTCWTSQLPKVVRACGALSIFTSKCASRHNGVHFLNISTSKSGPSMWCFEHFHFQMRFAPRRRAYFEHLNFQKCSDTGVFCTFWLWNVLRATTAWSQLRKVFRDRQFLTLLTSKCGSRHNCVQFFISHLARWLRTRRFSEPTFRRPNTLEKHSVSRLFYLFARLHLLSSAPFSSLLFSFLTLLFSESFLLWLFPPLLSVHIVGSLISKLPSINLFGTPMQISASSFVSAVHIERNPLISGGRLYARHRAQAERDSRRWWLAVSQETPSCAWRNVQTFLDSMWHVEAQEVTTRQVFFLLKCYFFRGYKILRQEHGRSHAIVEPSRTWLGWNQGCAGLRNGNQE